MLAGKGDEEAYKDMLGLEVDAELLELEVDTELLSLVEGKKLLRPAEGVCIASVRKKSSCIKLRISIGRNVGLT